MKRYLLICAITMIGFCEHGFALAVIDASNLAQNLVAAKEAVLQTQQQIQQLQTQLNQYKRMVQDAMNPGDWAWGDIQDTLNQLKYTMASVKNLSNQAGGFDQLLSQFGSYDDYMDGGGYGGGYSSASSQLMSGDYVGSRMQKDTADDLLHVIDEQQRQLDDYQSQLDRLKNNASSAEGQQEAIQYGNQIATMQVELLSKIHTLLMAQNNMMAAVVQTENNREARNRMGSALQMGETDTFRKERDEGSAKTFSFTGK